MLRETEEYHIPFLKRRKLINRLYESNFVIEENHVYVANPQEGHPRIGNHYLPVAFFVNRFLLKPVNLNEGYFKEAHNEIKCIFAEINPDGI